MFYKFARAVVWFLFKLIYKFEFNGLENIPEKGGYILAANHRSLGDAIFIAVKVKPRIYFMAKKELFWFPLGLIMKALGAFPVDRGNGDRGALDRADEIIRTGKILGIFPEGTRSKSGEPLRPKSGVAVIAKDTHADILPVGIHFGERLKFRSKVTVSYGKLIKFEELQLDGDSQHSAIKRASRLIMDRIIELADPEGLKKV